MPRKRHKTSKGPKILGALVILLVLALLFSYQWIRSYIRSDSFRVMLSEKLTETLHTPAELSDIRWQGNTMTTSSVTTAATELEANQIEAEVRFDSIFSDAWKLPSVTIQTLDLAPITKQDPAQQSPESSKPSFLARFLPQGVEIDNVSVTQLNLRDHQNRSLKRTTLAAKRINSENGYSIDLVGGKIDPNLALLNEAELIRAKLISKPSGVSLVEADLSVFDHGSAQFEGNYDSPEEWYLNGSFERIDSSEFFTEDWKKRLSGNLSGTVKLRASTPVEGSLQLKDGVLTALPILDTLAAYTDRLQFRRLTLNTAELDYQFSGNKYELTNITIASRGLVSLSGDLSIDQRELDGTFRLGLTPGTLSFLPGSELKIFKDSKDGMLWTTFKVWGTLDDPQNDLTERLIEAAGLRLFETLPESGQLALKYTQDAASEALTKSLESAKEIIPDAKELLPTDLIEEGRKGVEDAARGILDAFPAGGIFRPN